MNVKNRATIGFDFGEVFYWLIGTLLFSSTLSTADRPEACEGTAIGPRLCGGGFLSASDRKGIAQ